MAFELRNAQPVSPLPQGIREAAGGSGGLRRGEVRKTGHLKSVVEAFDARSEPD